MTAKVVLGMVRAAKGHKGPEWEEIAAVGCAVQVILPWKKVSKDIHVVKKTQQKLAQFLNNLIVIEQW